MLSIPAIFRTAGLVRPPGFARTRTNELSQAISDGSSQVPNTGVERKRQVEEYCSVSGLLSDLEGLT
jgi:hypothetical protein